MDIMKTILAFKKYGSQHKYKGYYIAALDVS